MSSARMKCTELVFCQCSRIFSALKRPSIELDTSERLIEFMCDQAGNLPDDSRSLHFHQASVRFLCFIKTPILTFERFFELPRPNVHRP